MGDGNLPFVFLGVFPGPWVKAASVLGERFLELPVVLHGAAGESPVAFVCVSTWNGTRDVICADILGMPPCNKVEEVQGHRSVAPEGW